MMIQQGQNIVIGGKCQIRLIIRLNNNFIKQISKFTCRSRKYQNVRFLCYVIWRFLCTDIHCTYCICNYLFCRIFKNKLHRLEPMNLRNIFTYMLQNVCFRSSTCEETKTSDDAQQKSGRIILKHSRFKLFKLKSQSNHVSCQRMRTISNIL